MGAVIAFGSIFLVIAGFFLKGVIMLALSAVVLWVTGFVYKPMAEELGLPHQTPYELASSVASGVASTASGITADLTHSAPQPPPAPAGFVPFWVKNHMTADMWSSPAGQSDGKSLGITSAQFCTFRAMRPPNGDRVFVFNPFTGDYFWVDASAIGPVPEPQHRPVSAKPSTGNCSEILYDQ